MGTVRPSRLRVAIIYIFISSALPKQGHNMILLPRVEFSWGSWFPQNLGASHEIIAKITAFCREKFSCVQAKWKQEENNGHRKKYTGKKKFSIKVRNFVSQERILYCRKEFPATGKYFLSHEDNSCYRNKFAITLTG